MKRTSMLVLGLFVALVALQGLAFAKTISGKVDAVDAAAGKLTVAVEGENGAVEKSELVVGADAKLTGVGTLNDLKAGDVVAVEAEEDAGAWKASSVTKS